MCECRLHKKCHLVLVPLDFLYDLHLCRKFDVSPLASKVIAIVPLGSQDHCTCALWHPRSLQLCPLASKITALVPFGFQGHCTCAHWLPRSLHMCPLASKFITFVQIEISAPYSVGWRLFPKFNMAESSPPK